MAALTEEQKKQIAYEDRTDDSLLTPDELRRKVQRQRKKASRENLKAQAAAEKVEKEKLEARRKADERYEIVDQIADYNSFWASQRETLTVEQRAEYQRIHDEMAEWTLVMDSYIHGTDDTAQKDLDDTVAEVIELMKTTDVAPSELVIIPKFWTKAERSFFNSVAGENEAARVFANYGHLLGPLSHVYAKFRQKFIQKRVEIEVPQYTLLECTACHSIASRTNVLPSIADAYKSLNVPYKCANCREQQSNHMNRVGEYNRAVKKPTIFDRFARLKDKDDD